MYIIWNNTEPNYSYIPVMYIIRNNTEPSNLKVQWHNLSASQLHRISTYIFTALPHVDSISYAVQKLFHHFCYRMQNKIHDSTFCNTQNATKSCISLPPSIMSSAITLSPTSVFRTTGLSVLFTIGNWKLQMQDNVKLYWRIHSTLQKKARTHNHGNNTQLKVTRIALANCLQSLPKHNDFNLL